MKPFNRDRERLLQILEAIGRIEPYIARGQNTFFADELIHIFITYWLAGIGETVKGLSATFRARHAEIDWNGPMAMRDVISHNYLAVSRSTGLPLPALFSPHASYGQLPRA